MGSAYAYGDPEFQVKYLNRPTASGTDGRTDPRTRTEVTGKYRAPGSSTHRRRRGGGAFGDGPSNRPSARPFPRSGEYSFLVWGIVFYAAVLKIGIGATNQC